MQLRSGVCAQLEEKATELILAALGEDKSDILTPWKQRHRERREILTSTGIADPSVRSGQFTRAWNSDRPDLNSRVQQRPRTGSGWDVDEGAPLTNLSSEMARVYGVERADD
jgi:hypothetical protein